MAATSIQDAIEIIRDFPYSGEQSARMVRVLSEHASLFAGGNFQFFVSMGFWLSVILDDGFYGIRSAEQRDHRWFMFGPDQRLFWLRTGFGAQIFIEREASEDDVATLLDDGIRHLIAYSSP